jgi:hypothetical protein
MIKIKGSTLICISDIGFIKKGDLFYCTAIQDDFFFLFSPKFNFDFKLNLNLLKHFKTY